MTPHAVILGAGPAGSTAALSLLAAGISVTIVERETFPRFRPGETLHPGVEPLLEQLGAADCLLSGNYLRHEGIWAEWGAPMKFSPYGGDASGPWRGFQAVRSDFDARLLQCAELRGARLLRASATGVLRRADGRVLGLETSAGTLASDWVFDCGGGGHRLAKWLAVPIRRFSPRLIARFGYVKGRCSEPTPVIRKTPRGWTWVAEISPGYFQWTALTRGEKHAQRPVGLQGADLGMARGADVTWRYAERMAGDGWFLTGDAASVLDPSGSHGVLRAIMSARMAATVAGSSNTRGAEGYHTWLREWLEHDMSVLRDSYSLSSDTLLAQTHH